VLLAVAIGAGACGGVYEEVSPPEKRRVTVVLVPDFVRVGDEEAQVSAFIDVAPEGTFVTAIELQAGVEVLAFDTRENRGCSGIADPAVFEGRVPFRLCLTLAVQEDAAIGVRDATFEVRVGNEPVIAETPFLVWNPLPQ